MQSGYDKARKLTGSRSSNNIGSGSIANPSPSITKGR